jgi:cephalosporin-C deacetylase-like acetyl esterase
MRRTWTSSLCAAASLLVGQSSLAQEAKPLPGDEMIHAYLKKRVEEIGKNFMAGAKTKAEWEKLRPKLKEQYLDMLGLWPLPEKTPLNAKVTGTLERGDVVIEKLHFQSKPGLYITGNLYRPKASREHERPEKLPAILYVCGHSNKGRDGNKTAFQDDGMWFASNGYVCLIIDSLQLGEVPGVHHGTYGIRNENYAIKKDSVETRFWWQSLGYTPAGVECWNGIRAIDYLISRDDVDAERIGVTGISGGGASTIWIAAADERVKVAVPVSGMSDLESYVTNKIINGHCDCMLLVNTYQWEWTTIAAMIAPRPLLFANSDKDPIFPMDGNRRIIARLRDCYKILGAPELVDEYVSAGGHDYRPDLRVAVFKFINKHLKKDNSAVKDADFKPLPGKELRVFADDGDLPKDAINAKIDETFVAAKRPKLPEEGKFEEWKKGLVNELRERSFRALPAELPPVNYLNKPLGIGEMATEPGIEINGYPVRKTGDPKALLVFDRVKEPPDWTSYLDKGANIWVLYPRGIDHNKWTLKSPPNYVERSHAVLGRTVDEGRVWDILATARHLKREYKSQVAVIASGQAGVLAAYSALFEPSVKEIVIIDPPTSHRDGPHFLNVMRVLDIPDALGLLAPRPLTIIGGKDKAFDRTAEIYKLAGAADKLKRE